MSHGSEKRQRSARMTIRLSPQEADFIRQLSAEAGIAPGALLRQSLLAIPLPKRRQARCDEKAVAVLLVELARVRAELGKSGSNLNQIAHYLNADRNPNSLFNTMEIALAEHEEAIRTLLELRSACMIALGREMDSPPGRKPPRSETSAYATAADRASWSGA